MALKDEALAEKQKKLTELWNSHVAVCKQARSLEDENKEIKQQHKAEMAIAKKHVEDHRLEKEKAEARLKVSRESVDAQISKRLDLEGRLMEERNRRVALTIGAELEVGRLKGLDIGVH
ncbi:unnamed protein product [Symbiodinium natans]|uniref:Uncharacterized protein n=1 Tax=Symbiodinium natans TaxID=878477 RepID=A0A812V2Z7_9DINO|nr:unnamed protein product [Symbiodinium natans]